MGKRTFEEINADVQRVAAINDVDELRALAAELQTLGTPTAEAAAVHAQGRIARLTGEFAEALELYKRATDLYTELGDRAGIARVTSSIGDHYRRTGNISSALEKYRESIALFEELDDRAGAAYVSGNIGAVYGSSGDFALALEQFRRLLAFCEEQGDHSGTAIAYNNIGLVYSSTGDYPTALEHFHRALVLHEEHSGQYDVALVKGNMGIVHANTGDHSAALEYYRQTIALCEEIGDKAGVAQVTGNMGNIFSKGGDHDTGLEYCRQALTLHEDIGDLGGVIRMTSCISETLMKLDRYDEAEVLLKRLEGMQIGDPFVRAGNCACKAMFAEHKGDLDAAQQHMMDALAVANEAGIRSLSAQSHELLRDLAQKRNDFAGYIEHNKEYLRITEEIRGKEATQKLAMMEAERKMEGERREREKERALLYGALPKSVADRMIRGEKITGDHFEHAAVLFIDVASFTAHTASMEPGDVVLLLEDLFSRIDSICDRYGAVKVKTIGDSYMCFRGDADAQKNALRMMHVALDVMSQSFTWPDGSPLVVRMGAHIGPATAGVIGTQRLQYDVWGDTVNVASRLESTSEPGRIHVSEAFASFLGLRPRNDSTTHSANSECSVIPNEVRNEEPGTWHLVLRGATELKGKGTMTTYWLERV